MIVLVTGGREYGNRDSAQQSEKERVQLIDALQDVHIRTPITCVVHGYANGADAIANAWALNRKIKVMGFRADWRKSGRAAGPERNARMVQWCAQHADSLGVIVLAAPGGRGTADCVRKAQAAGLRVIQLPDIEGAP